ncbi:heat-inducible transcriptional repressor HrcA, partial [Chloroflexota bacterium]
MLTERTGTILKHIVEQYISRATPVPSQSLASNPDFRVSPATIRNEMAYLEQEGYITRPHTSAGSVPSDKGYRYYVESLENILLPPSEQRMVSHLFHQVAEETEKWLSLTATLLSQLVKNMAIVTIPKPEAGKLKHMEMVSLQDSQALVVVVLLGAKVKQKLITFDEAVSQIRLAAISNKLNAAYSGLNYHQILANESELSPLEKQITDHLVEMIKAEDAQENEEPYLDGLHFILNQPEFAHS